MFNDYNGGDMPLCKEFSVYGGIRIEARLKTERYLPQFKTERIYSYEKA